MHSSCDFVLLKFELQCLYYRSVFLSLLRNLFVVRFVSSSCPRADGRPSTMAEGRGDHPTVASHGCKQERRGGGIIQLWLATAGNRGGGEGRSSSVGCRQKLRKLLDGLCLRQIILRVATAEARLRLGVQTATVLHADALREVCPATPPRVFSLLERLFTTKMDPHKPQRLRSGSLSVPQSSPL